MVRLLSSCSKYIISQIYQPKTFSLCTHWLNKKCHHETIGTSTIVAPISVGWCNAKAACACTSAEKTSLVKHGSLNGAWRHGSLVPWKTIDFLTWMNTWIVQQANYSQMELMEPSLSFFSYIALVVFLLRFTWTWLGSVPFPTCHPTLNDTLFLLAQLP